MDYNENDYRDHNLPLTGEDNSKISPVLRPFALPKFDFDDSLHGQLRFDSLVDSEVFLGIPNQEDNQWIEEFSQEGNGIEFSSSVAESCALPRHINVWSEATSSESVEMLLKAVGQEEMVEHIIRESSPVNQLGNSTRQMDDNLKQADKIDDFDLGNPSLKSNEVEGEFSRSIQSAGGENLDHREHTIHAEDTAYGHVGRDGTTENSNNDMKTTSDKIVETFGLVDESLRNQVQGPLSPTRDIKHAQNDGVSVEKCVAQDKIGDNSLISSSCVVESISDSNEKHKKCDKFEESLAEVAIETDNANRNFSLGIPSKMEASKEEHEVASHTTQFVEASDIPGKGNSESTIGSCNKVTFVDEPPRGSQHGTVAFSSGIEIQHSSENHNALHEESSLSSKGEGVVGLGMLCNDVTPMIDDNAELKSVPMISLSDLQKSPVSSENICHVSNSSLKASHATHKFAVILEAHDNLSRGDGEYNIYRADGSGNLKSSTISQECGEDKSMTDGMRDAGIALMQNDIIDGGGHDLPPLIAGSMQTCTEDIASMQVDAHANGLGVSGSENEDKTLPLDASDLISSYNEKGAKSIFSNAVNIEKTTGSQFNNSAGNNPVLNAEDENKKLTSPCIEHSESVGCHQSSSPSGDAGCRDEIVETGSKALEQPTTSVSKESSESSHASAVGIKKDLGSVVEEIKLSDQSLPLIETSSADVPDNASIKVGEVIEVSGKDLIVQGDGAEAAPTKKPLEAEKEKNDGTESSTVSVTCLEYDKSNQAAEYRTYCRDPAQTSVHKQTAIGSSNENSDKVLTTLDISGVNVPLQAEETFSFDIRPLSHQSLGDTGKRMQSLPKLQACNLASIVQGSLSVPGTSQSDATIAKESSHNSSVTAAMCSPSRGTMECKPRRGNNTSGKGSARRGNQIKDITPLRVTEKGGKSSQLLSPLANELMTKESTLKPRAVPIPTGSLPDLNTSAPPSAFFQQPFTDSQQVQLRAQIFVYGSLMQGAAPDETCMVSAFDGGRSTWELSWCACVERLQSHKAQGNSSETPLSSRPVSKAPDQSNRHGLHPSDVISSTAGRACNKAIPSPVNPSIHISSPLWSIATPSSEVLPPSSTAKSSVFDYQAVSPLSPYLAPIRNYITHSTGASQAPFSVPWLPSSLSSPFDISINYSSYPTMETLKLTPAKEASLHITSGTKQTSPITTTRTVASTVIAGTSLLDSNKVKVSGDQMDDAQTRKRKKSTVPKDVVPISADVSLTDTVSVPAVTHLLSKQVPALSGLDQISLIARNQTGSISTPIITSHYSMAVASATPSSSVQRSTTTQLYSMLPPSVPTNQFRTSDLSTDKSMVNFEGFSKVDEAKLQAEEAEAHATSAISQCEDLWGQLDQQANSGLTSDIESKLASAAVAIAAAASIAKAAAAAAKIASSVAVQAKHIADELATNSGAVDITEDGVNMSSAPTSMSKGGNWNNVPSSSISAVREAARKRIEAASAASNAENLDAILKATELAAEAVSHAGKIVAMGGPFSLSQLAMAGPNSYWKTLHMANMPGPKPDRMHKGKSGTVLNVYANQNEETDATTCLTSTVVSPIRRESSRNLIHGCEDNNFKPQQDKNASDLAKTAQPDPDVGLSSNSFALPSIKEGSCVELFKDHSDLRRGWYTARVLSWKDFEVLVSYTELKSDEGSELLKEWISVESKDGEIPKIRVAHPMTTVNFEGTRKRGRAAVKDNNWSVGDKVDAWLQDCWCEGIIAEKNVKDTTTLNVYFPAQGKTLMVKAWHLRPTLIWSDGKWTEWRRPGQEDGTSQEDTPVAKRTKLGCNSNETKGQGELAKNLIFGESARNEEPRLPVSANENVFGIGGTRKESKAKVGRTMRSDPQREGSRVVFGVPKPGKKRKFMDVSKHYVSDGNFNANVPNDLVKLDKFLPQQGLGSRGSRNNSKLDFKEKQVAMSKPKAPKSGNPPCIPRSTVTTRVDPSSSQRSIHGTVASDHSVKGSMSNHENESGEQNLTEIGFSSNIEVTSGASITVSSQALRQESHKKTTRNRANKGKLAPVSEKSGKSEADDKLISEVAEPRRSNRRIQPTSRLLEGLQTLPIIPKVLSQDTAHWSRDKGTTKGNKTRG